VELHRVTLRHFCQYESQVLQFTPGINLIVGPNGAGKSNAIKGIFGAITNDFSRNEGNKDENIRRLMPEGDRSEITLEMSHGGARLDILRGLSPSKASLTVTQDDVVKRYSGHTEVTNTILALLRVSPRMLSDYVFVDQWSIFGFLNMLPSKRKEAFQRLFGTEQADHIYTAATKHLAALSVPGRMDTVPVLTRLEAFKDQKLAVDEELKDYSDLVDYDPSADPLLNVLADWSHRQKLLNEIAEASKRLESCKKPLEESQQTVLALRVDVEHLRNYVNNRVAEISKLKEELHAYNIAQPIIRRRQDLQQSLNTLTRLKTELTIPSAPDGYLSVIDRHPFYTEMEDVRRELMGINKLLESVDSLQGSATCPTCGESTNNLSQRIEEARARKDPLTDKLSQLGRQLAAWEAYELKLNKCINRHAELSDNIASTEKQLAELATVSDAAISDVGAVKARITSFDEIATELYKAEKTLANFEIDLGRKTGQVSAMSENIELKTKEADKFAHISEQMMLEASNTIKDRERRYSKMLELEAKQQNLINSINDTEKLLAELVARDNEADGLRAWQKHLTEVRSAFHVDAAPRLTAQEYLEEMQDDINDILERLDTDFRVEAVSDDLSFNAMFHKGVKAGVEQPAGRLSGGEKVLLGVSTRVAINSRFAADIGLLVLDEPTAGLDANNLRCLSQAFDRLRQLSHSRGLQILMVTHDVNTPAADNVIEIGVKA